MHDQTILLSGPEIASLLPLPECIDAVERAFRAHGLGRSPDPAVLALHVPDGGFHVKAGELGVEGRDGPRRVVVAKMNANFPGNPERHGQPTIQGAVLLFDAAHGALLAVLDSGEITRLRTAAASAVAARHLARPDARTLAIVGCGVQGEAHLRALSLVRALERAWLIDADVARAHRLRDSADWPLEIMVERLDKIRRATCDSEIIVTCTPSRSPILHSGDVAPGVFVAAVGADHPEKHEIAADLLAEATLVTDVTGQAASMGDLRHAMAAGILTREAVYAELGEIVAGLKPGRRSHEEVVVFDSTGAAFQDAAAAVLVLENHASRNNPAAFR